jgi:hypothetical protein
MRLQLYAILLPLLLPIATASAVVADDWTLDNFGGFHNVTFDNVTIPTTVWEVLQGQGIVGEPSYRYAVQVLVVQVSWFPSQCCFHGNHRCAAIMLRD